MTDQPDKTTSFSRGSLLLRFRFTEVLAWELLRARWHEVAGRQHVTTASSKSYGNVLGSTHAKAHTFAFANAARMR